MTLKYHSVRTWSELCQRWFSSKAECRRGEELHLLEMAGELSDLRYQVKFVLFDGDIYGRGELKRQKITISIDFSYLENGERVFEDVKGVLTRDSRTKLAWLEQSQGIKVLLTK